MTKINYNSIANRIKYSCLELLSKHCIICQTNTITNFEELDKVNILYNHNYSPKKRVFVAMCTYCRSYSDTLYQPKCHSHISNDINSVITIFNGTNELRSLLKRNKYNDDFELTNYFAYYLTKFINTLTKTKKFDTICLAPTSNEQLITRLFHPIYQIIKKTALEDYELSKKIIIPFKPYSLKKSMAKTLSADREKNLSNKISVLNKFTTDINEKSVLIIDDMITTGATLKACASALKKSGAKEITALGIIRSRYLR